MNFSLFLSAIIILSTLGCAFAAGGSINITFTPEDPTSPQNVAADISLGQSIEGTIILTPPPSKPLRFNVVSTVPQIISPSHERVTFKTGQQNQTITLISQPDGQIGFVTLVITPEIPGTYVPFSFVVLVRGFSSAEFSAVNECVASQQAASVQITIDPIAPESVTFVAQAVNGLVSPQTVTIPTGQNTATVDFFGAAIGPSSITFTSSIYLPYTLRFNTNGQIKSVGSGVITAGAPSKLTLSLLPSNTAPVNITFGADNLDVSPTTITIPAGGSADVEIIGEEPGDAVILFNSANYCSLLQEFTVKAAPICSVGYTPNIYGTSCAICPGNNVVTRVFNNTCSNHGTCTYSTCVASSTSRCVCDFPYFGFACQYNSEVDSFFYEYLSSSTIEIGFYVSAYYYFDDLSISFAAPPNFISDNYVGGEVVIAEYNPDNSIFINPSVNPPNNSTASAIGWRFDITCADNTDYVTTFSGAVNVTFIDDVLTQNELARSALYYFDYSTYTWQNASKYCTSSQAFYDVDFTDNSVSTAFCRTGQYHIFIGPVPTLPANTGHSLNPFPSESIVSGNKPTTGVTGNNPIPPPLPVFTVTAGDPSLAQKLANGDVYANSSSFLRFSSLLIAFLFALFL